MIEDILTRNTDLVVTQVGIDDPLHDGKLKFLNKTMGASSVAALLGFSPFKKSFELVDTYKHQYGHFEPSVASELGHLLEEYIFNKAIEILPKQYPSLFYDEEVEFIYPKDYEYRNGNKHPHLTTNFDGVIWFKKKNIFVPLEIKRSDLYHKNGSFGPVNDYLYTQVQTQMTVLGESEKVPFAFTVQMDLNNKITTSIVYRNEDFIKIISEKVDLFFDSGYSIKEQYEYFTPEEKQRVTEKWAEVLDAGLLEEKKLDLKISAKKEENDDIINNIKEENFKTRFYTGSLKETKSVRIEKPIDFLKELLDNENIDCVKRCTSSGLKLTVPLNLEELEEKCPETLARHVVVTTLAKKTGRRNGKKLTAAATEGITT